MQLFNDGYDPTAPAAAEKGGLGSGRWHAGGTREGVLLLHVGGRARLQPLLAPWKRRAGSLIVLVAGAATLALWKIFFLLFAGSLWGWMISGFDHWLRGVGDGKWFGRFWWEARCYKPNDLFRYYSQRSVASRTIPFW